jgi:hypothetical protein
MFNLEEAIARWRESMQTAGIGPGDAREELESHLRDSFSSHLRTGLEPSAAFAVAAASLGSGRDLNREFNAGLGRWGRIKRLLGRRVEPFPADLRLCAWAILPSALILLDELVGALQVNAQVLGWSRMLGNPIGIFSLAMIGLAVGAFWAAGSYLRKPRKAAAHGIILFWCANLWMVGYVGLAFAHTYSRELTFVPTTNGWMRPLFHLPPWWAFFALSLASMASYLSWVRLIDRRMGKATHV